MRHPSQRDLEAAVEHARNITGEDDLSLEQFDLSFIGDLTVPQLRKYDDIELWLELDPHVTWGEAKKALAKFRGEKWALDRAMKWIKDRKVAPIVVITSRVQPGLFSNESTLTQIGDGRGRVNVANMFQLTVPTWHLIQRRV